MQWRMWTWVFPLCKSLQVGRNLLISNVYSFFNRPNRLKNSYRDCDGRCIYRTQQCDGQCPAGSEGCGSSCLSPNSWDSDNYRSCDNNCTYKYYQCNGECPAGYQACGSYKCIQDSSSHNFTLCGKSCMSKTSWATYNIRSCGDRCLYRSNFDNFYECSSDSNIECIVSSQSCNGTCPAGEQQKYPNYIKICPFEFFWCLF